MAVVLDQLNRLGGSLFELYRDIGGNWHALIEWGLHTEARGIGATAHEAIETAIKEAGWS